jgi:hypothetical protein
VFLGYDTLRPRAQNDTVVVSMEAAWQLHPNALV